MIKKYALKGLALLAALVTANLNSAYAQQNSTNAQNSTVTYPAEFFTPYAPFSVNDMLNRIPGITLAQGGGGGGGGDGGNRGPGSSDGGNRRGLGDGSDQVLINGRRIAGKENEGNDQLSRIPANQVAYIEIIRGTSGALDVRGGSQVINVVLLQAQSSTSGAFEVNADYSHDGKYQPGAKVSLTGQNGDFNYFLSGEIEPRWEFRDGYEVSVNTDGSLNDTVDRDDLRDSQPLTLVANLGYELGSADSVHLNLQWEQDDAPGKTDRLITNYNFSPARLTQQYDDIPETEEGWEIGGDYEHILTNGNRFKTLFIINDSEENSVRESFNVNGSSESKYLYLANYSRDRERIVRSNYSMGLSDAHDLEVGVEWSQTIADSSLQLGQLLTGINSPDFGGLVPVTNANGSVEEKRYEYFAINNWQINERMSLESTLLYETSTITQSGDISKSRDFNFLRPKLDYRFDITSTTQFRATIEKDVAQLSFSDFTANVSGGDDDQNALAGNPDLRQEQSWRYELNLEHRLPNNGGVFNTNVFYHEVEDLIDRVDVSTPTRIQSASGNIGDGTRYGIRLDGSLRLGFINLPEFLLTSRVQLEDSSVTDPFLGIDRRFRQQGRGSFNLGFRHDLPAYNLNYGANFGHNLEGGRYAYDIDKIEDYNQGGDFLTTYVEKVGWAAMTYRFEAMNVLKGERCRIRSRYVGGTIATGVLNEIEDSCSDTGVKLALKIRGSF